MQTELKRPAGKSSTSQREVICIAGSKNKGSLSNAT